MIVEPNDDGYLVSVPRIQGAFAEGDTIEEAMLNCVDVVKMIFDNRLERHKQVGFKCRRIHGITNFKYIL